MASTTTHIHARDHATPPGAVARGARRVGYAAAAVVNLALVWCASRVDEWWPSLFADSYDEVVPWITASLVATAAVNASWLVRDPPWWRHTAQAALQALSLAVAGRVWEVFPFDVARPGALALRALLVLWVLGSLAGIAVELAKLVSAPIGRGRPHPA